MCIIYCRMYIRRILNFQIVDLFSSLDKLPINTQVAIIDALEDFVVDWLSKHNLLWYVIVWHFNQLSVMV